MLLLLLFFCLIVETSDHHRHRLLAAANWAPLVNLLFLSLALLLEEISRSVLVDEGHRQVVELEQSAIRKFLWCSGTISGHMFVDQNREDHTVKFKQGKSGLMEKFGGCRKVEPLFVDEQYCSPLKLRSWAEYDFCTGDKGRIGSIVSLEQLIQPALVPPPPISCYLRAITARITEMLITDFQLRLPD